MTVRSPCKDIVALVWLYEQSLRILWGFPGFNCKRRCQNNAGTEDNAGTEEQCERKTFGTIFYVNDGNMGGRLRTGEQGNRGWEAGFERIHVKLLTRNYAA
jgi:hypothetical protein